MERPEEVKKPIEHQKSGIVNEQSSVSALKNMFDPKARKQTMEESISKVEGELQKGKELAKAQLEHAQQHLEQLEKQPSQTAEAEDLPSEVQEHIPTVEERLQAIEEKHYSNL